MQADLDVKPKIKEIQKQQEELIKSIVMKSAVFKQEFKEFKTEYKEEFI